MTSLFFSCLFASLFAVSTTLLIRTTKNSLELIDKLDELEEQLQASLIVLKEKHKILEAKSKTEVFFDDPVVKDIVREMSECRDVVSAIIENFESKEEN